MATSINKDGQLVTWGNDATLYDFRTGTTTVIPGISSQLYSSAALGINDSGQVVGQSAFDFDFAHSTMSHAWLTSSPGFVTPTDLNTLIDPKSGWMLEADSSIDNSGRIVGVGLNSAGETHYFLLTHSVPEPTSVLLLGAGSLAALGRRFFSRTRTA